MLILANLNLTLLQMQLKLNGILSVSHSLVKAGLLDWVKAVLSRNEKVLKIHKLLT
jgi:hypothetical protein